MKRTKPPIKTLAFFALCILLFIIPWWSLFMLLVFCIALFDSFYAGIFIALAMDLLYGTQLVGGMPFLFTALALLVAVSFPALKRRFSFSDSLRY